MRVPVIDESVMFSRGGLAPVPATVFYVHTDGSVNLKISETYSRRCVRMLQPGEASPTDGSSYAFFPDPV